MTYKRLIIILIIVGVIFYILPASVARQGRNSGRKLLSPVNSSFRQLGLIIKSPVNWIITINSIQDENAQLKGRVAELSNQLIELENLRKENKSLKSELELRPEVSDFKRVVSKVISLSSPTHRQVVLINQGTNSGIAEGDAVVASGSLVGKVIEALPNTASVLLITSSDSLIQARLTATGEKGLVSGQLAGIFLTDLPNNSKVEKGMLVESSGLGGSIPAGILIGETTDQKSSSQQANFQVRLHSNIDFTNLDLVFVLTKEGRDETIKKNN